ncbi:DUF2304 domain-containing protein [Georgenia sp. AZ-5]|uniref:DUF2304 domain-containing protein n=1 Tax=Georgenia sp. AZ-5 TaxID=3367526 RepID=UPI003754A1BD
MWIQVILVLGFVVVALWDLRSSGGARHQAIRRILLVVFIGLAVFSVLFPSWLTWVAVRLGVGRGADLVLYALVVAFLSFIATTYRRFSTFDRKITALARDLALAEARLQSEESTVRSAGAADRQQARSA